MARNRTRPVPASVRHVVGVSVAAALLTVAVPATAEPGDPGPVWHLRASNDAADQRATTVGPLEGPGWPLACALEVGGPDRPGYLEVHTRPGTFVLRDGDGTVVVRFGRGRGDYEVGDQPLCGDWDGDGVDTVGIMRYAPGRPNEFHLARTNADGSAADVQSFGRYDDQAVVGDWDGDGIDTVGLVRREGEGGGMRWFLSDVPAGTGPARASATFTFGRGQTDAPLAGDWDGDGTDSVGVHRLGRWYLSGTEGAGPRAEVTTFRWGKEYDEGLVGDWIGDGTHTPAVVRYPHD
jgi:hypothetical protein